MKCYFGNKFPGGRMVGIDKRSWSWSTSILIVIIYNILTSTISCYADKIQTEAQAVAYLTEYGYLNLPTRNSFARYFMAEEAYRKAIIEFQAFANLDVTGELNEETRNMMSMPRCGVRDTIGLSKFSRSKRYALQGSRWKVKKLSYRISKYPKNLSKAETDNEVIRAFAVWSEVSPLVFTKKNSGQVHIEIRFETGEHGDGDPFDGPGGTLAHAFFPIFGGDAHFDDTEKWTVKSPKGTNLFQVAAHEFGHSLGLLHSDVKSALMAPFYKGYETSFKLDPDDVEAIQFLYGAKDSDDDKKSSSTKNPIATTTTEVPEVTLEDEELCNNATIDAIFNSANDITYVFKGANYWQLTDNGIAQGFPKKISEKWAGLPNDIDTAFTYKNGKTYFFKGSKYWKYDDTKIDGDYPKNISEGFVGIPDNIQAATVWTGNGKIYFFKGTKFWRFDASQNPPVKNIYPKPISSWEGIPDDIDDALHYKNGFTYFFKQGQYWRFNDKDFMVDSNADPVFPRNVGQWWFGCKAAA